MSATGYNSFNQIKTVKIPQRGVLYSEIEADGQPSRPDFLCRSYARSAF